MSLFKKNKDKEIEKELNVLEEELEKEIPEEKFSLVDFIFDKDPDEEEENKYLTEEEKEEVEEMKREEKRLFKIAGIIFSSIITASCILLFIFNYMIKSDLEKVTIPILEKYYKEKYNKKLEKYDVKYLCKKDEDCHDLVLLTTKDNTHILSLNNELIGDDISVKKINNEYDNFMHNKLAYLDIISNHSILSYKDYYHDYNIHADHIKALPSGVDFGNLINSKKLVVTDVIFYQGEIDDSILNSFINNFHEDSSFYLVKTEKGLPKNLRIKSLSVDYSYNITSILPVNEIYTYYELDRTNNRVVNVDVKKIGISSINTLGEYNISNGYKILRELRRVEKDEEVPSFYFIKLNNTSFNESNIYEFSVSSYGQNYTELKEEEYKKIVTYKLGDDTYIIGSDDVGIGNIAKKESFLCKIGIC